MTPAELSAIAKTIGTLTREVNAGLADRVSALEQRGETKGIQGEPGPVGPSGPPGDPGPRGERGERGASFTAGAGAPTFDGSDGDVYLDAKTGDIYLCR